MNNKDDVFFKTLTLRKQSRPTTSTTITTNNAQQQRPSVATKTTKMQEQNRNINIPLPVLIARANQYTRPLLAPFSLPSSFLGTGNGNTTHTSNTLNNASNTTCFSSINSSQPPPPPPLLTTLLQVSSNLDLVISFLRFTHQFGLSPADFPPDPVDPRTGFICQFRNPFLAAAVLRECLREQVEVLKRGMAGELGDRSRVEVGEEAADVVRGILEKWDLLDWGGGDGGALKEEWAEMETEMENYELGVGPAGWSLGEKAGSPPRMMKVDKEAQVEKPTPKVRPEENGKRGAPTSGRRRRSKAVKVKVEPGD